jgi:cyclase
MPTLLFKEHGLVKGERFDASRRVGAAHQAVKVYNMRQVDELVFLDIAATARGQPPDFALIDELADLCFMPLTVGGGVRSVEDVRRLLGVGADKVAINTAAFEQPDLIEHAARLFGSQSVVVSIDAIQRPGRGYEAMIRCGTTATGLDPIALANQAAERGAGEILLTSIDRDGTMNGYDLELIRSVAESVGIPVIASGGAGSYEHMAQALQLGCAAAVAAASMFHFTEQTPLEAKRYLAAHGVRVRL